MYYVLFKLKVLIDMTFNWNIISVESLKHLIKQFHDEKNNYLDSDSCILANVKYFNVVTPKWFYVCSKASLRKYKVLVIPLNNSNTNSIFTSEVMRHNMETILCCNIDNCFLRKYNKYH